MHDSGSHAAFERSSRALSILSGLACAVNTEQAVGPLGPQAKSREPFNQVCGGKVEGGNPGIVCLWDIDAEPLVQGCD